MERKGPGDKRISIFHDLGLGSISSINAEFLLKTDGGYPTDAEDAIEPANPGSSFQCLREKKQKRETELHIHKHRREEREKVTHQARERGQDCQRTR